MSCYGKKVRILIKYWSMLGHRPETMLDTSYKLNNSDVFSLLNPCRLGYKKEDYNLETREIRQRLTPLDLLLPPSSRFQVCGGDADFYAVSADHWELV